MTHESGVRAVTIEPLDPRMVEALRGMTERQRLEIAWDMWRSARNMILNLLRSEHPDWSEREVALEAGRRLLADELPLRGSERVYAIEVLDRRQVAEPPIGGNEALD